MAFPISRLGYLRSIMPSCGSSFRPALFPNALKMPSKAYSRETSEPLMGKVKQTPFKKAHSVVFPLGSQKVYIPSKKLAEEWDEKMKLIQQYLVLPPREKEFRLMELSLRKFYRSQSTPLPMIQAREDLEKAFAFVCTTLEQSHVSPVRAMNPRNPGEIDLVTSVSATINKFFTQQDFTSRVRIQSVTEYFWYYALDHDYIFPFTAEREDLHTMVQMGLPLLDATTLYHEVGAGSGEGIIEILHSGYTSDRMPGSIVGTDINPYSLESVKLLVEEEFGGLDNVYLRYGNAADSLDDVQLGFTPKVVVLGANRFFSILDPNVFNPILRGFQQQISGQGYLISGITVNSARNLHQLEALTLKRHPDRYELEECEYGMVLYRKKPFQGYMEREGFNEESLVNSIHLATSLPKKEIDISRVVRQVYYDPTKFRKSVEAHSFEMVESKAVLQAMHDEREVVLFRKKQ